MIGQPHKPAAQSTGDLLLGIFFVWNSTVGRRKCGDKRRSRSRRKSKLSLLDRQEPEHCSDDNVLSCDGCIVITLYDPSSLDIII